jgi:small conductance mechanosensitive channel
MADVDYLDCRGGRLLRLVHFNDLFQDTAVSGARAGAAQPERLTDVLGPQLTDVLEKGIKALAILVLAWVGYRILKALTTRLGRQFEDEESGAPSELEQRAKTLVGLLNSIGAAVITVTAVLMILNLFINIGPLLAGVGVAGLAVSFGAQSLVKDVISGFFLLFENQFGVGDIVQINDKSGVVERMTLRIVALRDLEGVLHIMPNGGITSVSNKTRQWARVVVDIGVAYEERIDDVLDVLRALADEFWQDVTWQPLLAATPRVLGLQALTDSAMNIRVMVDTKPGKQWDVKRELLRRVKNRFDREHIEIPFPQRTVHMKGTASPDP